MILTEFAGDEHFPRVGVAGEIEMPPSRMLRKGAKGATLRKTAAAEEAEAVPEPAPVRSSSASPHPWSDERRCHRRYWSGRCSRHTRTSGTSFFSRADSIAQNEIPPFRSRIRQTEALIAVSWLAGYKTIEQDWEL
jgi:hypothetical protein